MSRDDARPDERDPEERWGDPEERWGDPEERWGDVETDLVDVPAVDVPDAAGDGEVAVDGDLATTFWVTVVLVNVAVAGVSVGAMLVYFRGDALVGGGAVAVGVVALVRAYDRYRDFRAGEDGEAADGDADELTEGVTEEPRNGDADEPASGDDGAAEGVDARPSGDSHAASDDAE